MRSYRAPLREFIVFSMLEVTDKRLRARAHRRHGPGQSRRRSLGRAPSSLAAATPHHSPRTSTGRLSFLLAGGSSSAETLTELPRSSGQGHAPSRSSGRVLHLLSFRLPLPLTLPASSLLARSSLSSSHDPSYSFRTVPSHERVCPLRSSFLSCMYARVCIHVHIIRVYFIFDLGPSRFYIYVESF